jgi:hypothetical protein
MKILQLTAIVRDTQTATMVAQSFMRSPVLVGRQFGNQLRLDARIVSRRHGAFLFSKDGLQYVDYASANGSYVDGVRVEPNRPIEPVLAGDHGALLQQRHPRPCHRNTCSAADRPPERRNPRVKAAAFAQRTPPTALLSAAQFLQQTVVIDAGSGETEPVGVPPPEKHVGVLGVF